MEAMTMYKRILIPTDGSDLSIRAIHHGIALAKSLGAKVSGMTVTVPFHVFAIDPDTLTDTPASYQKRVAATAAKYLAQIKETAATGGVSCDVVHVEHEQPYQAIIDTAKKDGCDLIVMASHGRRGVSALVLGSETVKVLTHSTIPVLVYR
jgi:nucleotide-binding universal stress UspA family protein